MVLAVYCNVKYMYASHQALEGVEAFSTQFSEFVEQELAALAEVPVLCAGPPRDAKILMTEAIMMAAIDALSSGENADRAYYVTVLENHLGYVANNAMGIDEADIHPTIVKQARQLTIPG